MTRFLPSPRLVPNAVQVRAGWYKSSGHGAQTT
jgi:hypothetical protein